MITAALLVSASARAGALSIAGILPGTSSVALTMFALGRDSMLDVQSFGYGGTRSAPRGFDAAGMAVAAGGFEPYLAIFAGTGPGATSAASSYGITGNCPPADATLECADPGFSVFLPRGRYTLAISDFSNISFAESYGFGTLGDGFTGFVYNDFTDSFGNFRTGAYEVDVLASSVPEPMMAAIFGLSAILISIRQQRRSGLIV